MDSTPLFNKPVQCDRGVVMVICALVIGALATSESVICETVVSKPAKRGWKKRQNNENI
jgi:hypothetical protein